MGETKTPHFYDFGIFEPVTNPQNQLFLSLETPGDLKEIKGNPWDVFLKYEFYESWNFENSLFDNFGKDGHRQMMKDRVNKSPKSWMRDQ